METINRIVNEALSQHEGGEKFFDLLDEKIRTVPGVIIKLLSTIPKEKRSRVICSGKFANKLNMNIMFNIVNKTDDTELCKDFKYMITVEGGLRKTKELDLSDLRKTIEGNNYIFIDDSFYSGATRNVIRDEIVRCGGTLTDTYVVYDGSHKKEDNVHSLFRYYEGDTQEYQRL